MTQELIASKTDLLQEQIDNLEKSGFFTEKEMDRLSSPYRMELAVLKSASEMRSSSDAALNSSDEFISLNKYGMSNEEYETAKAKHNNFFAPLKAMNIEVIDAEILTLNHQEA